MKQKKMMMQQDSSRSADDAALKPFAGLSEAFKGCRVQYIRKSPARLHLEALER